MIINFNVTGKETDGQLVHIAMDAVSQFQQEALSGNGRANQALQMIFAIMGMNLVAMHLVNESMNEAHDGKTVNVAGGKELVKLALAEKQALLADVCNNLVAQIENGVAHMKEFKA